MCFAASRPFTARCKPVGTIIIDKPQHFLYLIQPNNVALRYGIAVGRECTDLVGLRHIASMAEWPPGSRRPTSSNAFQP